TAGPSHSPTFWCVARYVLSWWLKFLFLRPAAREPARLTSCRGKDRLPKARVTSPRQPIPGCRAYRVHAFVPGTRCSSITAVPTGTHGAEVLTRQCRRDRHAGCENRGQAGRTPLIAHAGRPRAPRDGTRDAVRLHCNRAGWIDMRQ